MIRICSIIYLFVLCVPSVAQVNVHLENGTHIEGEKYTIRDSALLVDSDSIPLSSILLLQYHTLNYLFEYGSNKKSKTKINETQSVCNRARLFAMRYASTIVNPHGNFDPLLQAKDTSEWRKCFFETLMENGIDPFDNTQPRIAYDNTLIKYDSTMLVMRNGDTLSVFGPMYFAKGIVRFSRANVTVRQQDVLMLLTPSGQKVIHASSGKLSILRPQVTRLEPCSYGIIYARMYWDAVSTPMWILGLDKTLASHDDFQECFYRKQHRMQKGNKAAKLATGVLGVSKHALNGF